MAMALSAARPDAIEALVARGATVKVRWGAPEARPLRPATTRLLTRSSRGADRTTAFNLLPRRRRLTTTVFALWQPSVATRWGS